MLGDMLTLDILIQSQPLTTEWAKQLLHHLWAHGLRFHNQADAQPTWEEELAESAFRLFQENNASSAGDLSLQDFLQRIAGSDEGLTACWDKELEMNLLLNPTGERSQPEHARSEKFGLVRLWVDGSYLHPDVIAGPLPEEYRHGRLLTPAQQVLAAFTHWASVLCDYLEPLFALGEEPARFEKQLSRDYRGPAHQALSAGSIPESKDWPFLVYIAPQFLHSERLRSIYEVSGRWVKRTRRGGLLIVDPLPSYAYETGEAYRQMVSGETIGGISANTNEDYEQAARYFERARGIFAHIPSERDELSAKAEVERMHASIDLTYQLEEMKQLPKRVTLLLDTDSTMETLSQELARILETEAVQMVKGQTLYRLPGQRFSLLLKQRDEPGEKTQADVIRGYRYEGVLRITESQVGYDSPQDWLSTLETQAYSIFDTLKKDGKYRLALLGRDGSMAERFERE